MYRTWKFLTEPQRFYAPDDLEGTTETPPVTDTTTDDDADPPADQFLEHNGVRYVKSDALKAVRGQLKDVKGQAKQLKEKADKYDLVHPYLGLLTTHPSLTRQGDNVEDEPTRGRRATSPPPPPPAPIQEVTEFDDAISSLGIDPKAGRKLATLVSHIADRRSARALAPVAAAANQTASQNALQRAYQATDNDGNLYASREAIDEVFRNIPANMLAGPDADKTIQLALIQARGLGGPGGPLQDPTHTEDVAGRRGSAKKDLPLGAMEKKLMERHGIADEKEFNQLGRQDNFILE